MPEYFIALRAVQLHDDGSMRDHGCNVSFTTQNIVKRDWLIGIARQELDTRYPVSARWVKRQYSFDGKTWEQV